MTATIPITDAVPGAVSIVAADLRLTDRVFDTTGGTHALRSVWRRGRGKRFVLFRRDDSDTVHSLRSTETLTVWRAEG